MKITDVKVFRFSGDGNLKGFASVTIEGQLVLTGIKIMTSKNGGEFVAMPSQKVKEEYKDIFFPITKEFRQTLIDAVMDKYNDDSNVADLPTPGDETDELPF